MIGMNANMNAEAANHSVGLCTGFLDSSFKSISPIPFLVCRSKSVGQEIVRSFSEETKTMAFGPRL